MIPLTQLRHRLHSSALSSALLSLWLLACLIDSISAAEPDLVIADFESKPLPSWLTNAAREFSVDRRYLNLPVKNGAPKRIVRLLIDGQPERQFEIELADTRPDWWAFLDLTEFRGKKARIQVDRLLETSLALSSIESSDTLRNAEDLYRESLRPQFHVTARRGWNNDPNGLVYYAGEYHLFFQHNPYGWNWGNMHWAHAVSPDLVHWKELPIALYPDPLGTMFSGSAVVDYENTAGFQSGSEKTIVCMYTAAGGTSLASKGQPFTQCLAYSNDRGRSWTKFHGNPVLGHLAAENRDPKVIWYAPHKKWVMALYLDKNDFALFASPNLKTWEKLCDVRLPGSSECPEFFELPLEGAAEARWIFYGGNGAYLIGRFDGRQFAPESGPHPLNFGNCFYASQTFNLDPGVTRRILMPWGQVQLPGMPFNQMIGLPVELTLRTTASGLRLFTYPVRELDNLRTNSQSWTQIELQPAENPLAHWRGDLFDLETEIAPGHATEIGFNLRGIPVRYDVATQTLICLDRRAPLKLRDGRIQLRVLLDRASIDIFGNEGEVYMPMGIHPKSETPSLELFTRGAPASIRRLDVHALRSAWQ